MVTIPNKKNLKNIVIAIDNGHGINTAGKRTPPFPNTGKVIREWEFNHACARKLKEVLEKIGFSVIMTSDTSVDTPLRTRTNIANQNKADIFISIHYNAYKGQWGSHGGIETLYLEGSSNGRILADIMQEELLKATKLRDRKVQSRPSTGKTSLTVLIYSNMPAVLVECGFMDNIEEASLMLDPNYQMTCALALAKGVTRYFNVDMKPQETTPPITMKILNFQRVLSKGMSGEDVKYLQSRLKELNFLNDNADGIFGNLTDIAVKNFQKAKSLVVDGYVGKATVNKLNEIVETVITPEIPKPIIPPIIRPIPPVVESKGMYIAHDLQVWEVSPDDCYVAHAKGKNLRQLDVYGINGTWQDTANAKSPLAIWGLVANKFGAIGGNSHQNSPRGYKRGTIIYYQDKTLDIQRIDKITDIKKPINWAIGGGSLYPVLVLEENFPSDIMRNTHHTGVAIKGNKVLLIVTNTHCTMSEFRNRVIKLGVDKAIFLDGGGTSQMRDKNNKGLHSTRPLASGLFVK